MNEKFFDLKKEKQDRMINAAIKIFGINGYEHASTDDIVKEAGISKGLLFHYFISKIGLYDFVYDYSVKYLTLELSTGISATETDYFALVEQIKNCELQVMRTYPYMLLFLNKCREETVAEALASTEEKKKVLPGQYEQIMQRVDLDRFKSDVKVDKLTKIINLTADGLMKEQFAGGAFVPEQFTEELRSYLTMLKKLSYREG